uniref:Secreted protein n=1 Tax=Lepeophtheirus salmonis TaxID=72036 RepID=A0A0K2UMD3_LEPSM
MLQVNILLAKGLLWNLFRVSLVVAAAVASHSNHWDCSNQHLEPRNNWDHILVVEDLHTPHTAHLDHGIRSNPDHYNCPKTWRSIKDN